MEDSTVIKHQWLVMQQIKRKDHPNKAAIIEIIITINKKVKEGDDMILSIDGNTPFSNASGGISKICREYKHFDQFDHKYRNNFNTKSRLCGSQNIDFTLCSFNISTAVIKYGMTGFNEITTSDYCGLSLHIFRDVILKGKKTSIPSPFERQLYSKAPKSVRKYKTNCRNK